MSVTEPAVSVLMPVLNPEPRYLEAAVRAVLEQSFTDLELIITEDPGTRSAEPLVQELGDPRVVYQRNVVRGRLTRQRNQGIEAARAPLIALADSDDICEPNRIEKQVTYLAQHPEVDLLSCQLRVIDAEGGHLGYRQYPLTHAELVARLPFSNPIAQPGMMFRKQVVVEAGGYSYEKFNVNSDYDLWCRLALSGARFATLPEPLVQYRIHPGGIKSSKLREVLTSTVDIKRTYFSEAMGVRGRLRCAAEYALRYVPAPVVLGLFMRTQFQREVPHA